MMKSQIVFLDNKHYDGFVGVSILLQNSVLLLCVRNCGVNNLHWGDSCGAVSLTISPLKGIIHSVCVRFAYLSHSYALCAQRESYDKVVNFNKKLF